MVAKIQSEKVSTTSRNTRSKSALQDLKNKDPNASVFTDTSGYVSESLIIEWSRIYTIFDNDDLSSIDHDQLAYLQISNSQISNSMFQGANNYKHEMHKIIGPERKLILYKYQKEVKTKNVGERGDKLKIKEDIEKEKT